MIAFTDKRLYVQGTCSAILTDKSTGDIKYFSDKFQTANVTTSVNAGEIRAGLGNGIADIIPTDSALNVEFTAADFNMFAKVAQVGGTLGYSAPAMTSQVVTATGSELTINVDGGVPVAPLGLTKVMCYVQEVGVSSPISQHGTAYPIGEDGKIADFTATSGTKYKVWYCVNKATAQVATIPSFIDPAVYHFTAQMAVYTNAGGKNTGSRCGWLYIIVPSLKLGGTGGGVVGDQTTADTTSISGQAVISDSEIVDELAEPCSGGSVYAYYVYVSDDNADAVSGLAVVGGVVNVKTSGKTQIPVKFVMENGQLVTPNYGDLTYKLTGAPSGTTVNTKGVITSGTSAGECEGTATYEGKSVEFDVVVVAKA